MKIIFSNDDGIEGEGLRTLASAFSRAGHEVGCNVNLTANALPERWKS